MIKNKKLIFLVALTIINILFILIIFQLLKDIKETSLAFVSQKKEIILLENKIKDLKEFEKEFKLHKQELEKINKLFPELQKSEELINFLNFLRETATNSGVVIEISPLSSKISGQPWPFYTFQISCKGKFLNVMRFLEKLENSPYLIEISHLFITKIEAKEGYEEIKANLSFKVFSK